MEEHGVQHLAMVHDSFGTHAANTGTLSREIRQTAYAIYQHDWIDRLYREFAENNVDVDIPEPPDRGTFDPAEVLEAPYFFD